jgi:DNA-binding Xre family transcriptional regulator
MLPKHHHTEKMKSPKNPEIYWKIKEMAVTARCTVGELLQEAGVSANTVRNWVNTDIHPRASTIRRLNEAAAKLKGRA